MLDVRPAAAADAAAAAEVFLAARAGMTYLPEVHPADETREFVRDVVVASGRARVATRDDQVVGLAWWSQHDGDGWLDGLYLHPDAQGRGVGGALFEAVTRQLPDGFLLWVFQQNTGARRFYERRGAVLVRETDGRDNEERTPDALLRWQPHRGRVLLRATLARDIDTLYEQQADPASWQMAVVNPKNRDEHAAHVERITSDPELVSRSVVADGELVGSIGCWPDDGEWAVGYVIGSAFWGRGLATAALNELVTEVHRRPLVAHVADTNPASRRVLEKCGFVQTDVLENAGDPPVTRSLVMRLSD